MESKFEAADAYRRAQAEANLEFAKIRTRMMARVKQYIQQAQMKSIADGGTFDADQIGKDAATFAAEPWSVGAKPALEHRPAARKPRKR
jgi:hypothetical protein